MSETAKLPNQHIHAPVNSASGAISIFCENISRCPFYWTLTPGGMAIVKQIPFPVATARVICRARFARYAAPTAETSMPAIVPAGPPTMVPNAVKAAASASGPMPAATVTAVAMPIVRSE